MYCLFSFMNNGIVSYALRKEIQGFNLRKRQNSDSYNERFIHLSKETLGKLS